MQIGVQALRPATFNHHLVALSRRKKSRKRQVMIGLTLTSMVDMFSLLVIFLLQSFSTSPELLFVSKGVVLPSANTAKEVKDAPVLSLTTAGVYLDQKFVGLTDDLLKDPAALMHGLSSLRKQWLVGHPGEEFPGEISLQAHKGIPSTIVSQFMGMLPGQSFGSIQLAVLSGGP